MVLTEEQIEATVSSFLRKRQNMFQAILWGGLAVAVLGVAVTTGRKGTK